MKCYIIKSNLNDKVTKVCGETNHEALVFAELQRAALHDAGARTVSILPERSYSVAHILLEGASMQKLPFIYQCYDHSNKQDIFLTEEELETYAPEIQSGIIEIMETIDPNAPAQTIVQHDTHIIIK